MAFLELKNIGKIYASDGNVAVGIRGVNLSFELGEFVAVTGQSGSGKTTLLNILSGMDSYEEGELLIEGQPTSHYLQPDWEEYRKQYISFIFQDYNIIESFSVLQNVELALMHIPDVRERRKKAMELIRRVGLERFAKHKGSKLSGGQKQRTVIARALAKESPIILADEPTGNLDSQSSKEIIDLLYEVSRDKLVIVVTHNFEQVEAIATRHVRIFDGAVASDHVIQAPAVTFSEEKKPTAPKESKERGWLKDGLTLGRHFFLSKPKLSLFLCLLIALSGLALFFFTSSVLNIKEINAENHLFHPSEGRVVLIKRSGERITDEELLALAEKTGAKDVLHFDPLLDSKLGTTLVFPELDSYSSLSEVEIAIGYDLDFGKNIVGRYPEKRDEVLLNLPIGYSTEIGRDELKVSMVQYGNTLLKVVGVHYYYDNNLTAQMTMTREGFGLLTSVAFYSQYRTDAQRLTVQASILGLPLEYTFDLKSQVIDYDLPAGTVYFDSYEYRKLLGELNTDKLDAPITKTILISEYDRVELTETVEEDRISSSISEETLNRIKAVSGGYLPDNYLVISPEVAQALSEQLMTQVYKQASLFYANDKEAAKAAETISDTTYLAVLSDVTYESDILQAILHTLKVAASIVVWALGILFLAFFINLCTGHTVGAFKHDMTIMRSMGIPVKVIRCGVYVRMLIALVPALLLMVCSAVLIFVLPAYNALFTYLYWWQYLFLGLSLILMDLRVVRKQEKKLFQDSVRKTMRGGADA